MSTQQQQDFLEIVEQYKKLIYKVAHIYCSKKEEQQDLIQEIILQLWQAYPKYDETFALSTWVYRISLNVSISYNRKIKTRNKTLSEYQYFVQIQKGTPPKDNNQLELLHTFIDRLSDIDKAIIILYLENYTNSAIAEVMGISISNVSTRIHRIKQKLKLYFKTKTQ